MTMRTCARSRLRVCKPFQVSKRSRPCPSPPPISASSSSGPPRRWLYQWSAQGGEFQLRGDGAHADRADDLPAAAFATRTAFPFTPAARKLYAISGLSLFVAMLLTYWGALHIPSGLISVIFGLSPLVTGVFAALWLSERTLTPLRLRGLGVALTGLWVIFGQPWPGDSQATLGVAAVVIGMTVQALGLGGGK